VRYFVRDFYIPLTFEDKTFRNGQEDCVQMLEGQNTGEKNATRPVVPKKE